MQSDKISNAWVWACPRGDFMLNARRFPVVVQTYFRVKQKCLEGLVSQSIRQKSRGNILDKHTTCDAYGEIMVKATLP
jgi:hypothetical protein